LIVLNTPFPIYFQGDLLSSAVNLSKNSKNLFNIDENHQKSLMKNIPHEKVPQTGSGLGGLEAIEAPRYRCQTYIKSPGESGLWRTCIPRKA